MYLDKFSLGWFAGVSSSYWFLTTIIIGIAATGNQEYRLHTGCLQATAANVRNTATGKMKCRLQAVY